MLSQTDDAALARSLAEAGLIGFGRFEQAGGGWWPVAIRLGWLPSYPALLRAVARSLVPLLDGLAIDRVLAAPGALPIAVALSLETGIPAVYAAPGADAPAYAIEGAYDVGHPTALLSDVLLDAGQADAIITLAGRVGLDVHALIAVLDLGLGAREALEARGWTVRPALTLAAALPVLETAGYLPPVMRASVAEWIADCRRDPGCG